MPRGQLEPPHALVQERNSFPDFRSSSLPPAAPARDTKSDALLNDIAAQLRECRRRSRPPRPENLELPKVIWEGSRFGGARAKAAEDAVKAKMAAAQAFSPRARSRKKSLEEKAPARLPRIPTKQYRDVEVVDVRHMAARLKRVEYYTGPPEKQSESGDRLNACRRRWLGTAAILAGLWEMKSSVDEFHTYVRDAHGAAVRLQRVWRARRRRRDALWAVLRRGAWVLGRLRLRARARAAETLRAALLPPGPQAVLKVIHAFVGRVAVLQRFWRAVRWAHRLRSCCVHARLLACAADARTTPEAERLCAVRTWLRDRFREEAPRRAEHARQLAKYRERCDAGRVVGAALEATRPLTPPPFWRDNGSLGDLLRRVRKGHFRVSKVRRKATRSATRSPTRSPTRRRSRLAV